MTTPPRKVSQVELCSEPAKFLCDPALNPAMEANNRSVRTFFKGMEKVEPLALKKLLADPALPAEARKELESLSRGEISDFNLTAPTHGLLRRTKSDLVEKSLYTEERKAKVTKIVERAKTDLLRMLEEKKTSAAPNAAMARNIQTMIDKIRSVKSFFGSAFGLHDKAKFQAYAFGKEQGDGVHLGHDHPSFYVEGFITMADEAPESLYFILMHELSHHLGADNFPVDSDNPFGLETECLTRPDAAGVNVTDLKCMKELAAMNDAQLEQRNINRGAEFRKAMTECLSIAEKNPYEVPYCPSLWVLPCNKGQLGESLADYLGTEAAALSGQLDAYGVVMPDSAGNVAPSELRGFRRVAELAAPLCLSYNAEVKDGNAASTYPEAVLNRPIRGDPHPLSVDRINGIVLANPKFKRALGCDKGYTNELTFIDEKPIAVKPMTFDQGGLDTPRSRQAYCGRRLYHFSENGEWRKGASAK
jgi:hypothetical protein